MAAVGRAPARFTRLVHRSVRPATDAGDLGQSGTHPAASFEVTRTAPDVGALIDRATLTGGL